jgi:hypothetical protein
MDGDAGGIFLDQVAVATFGRGWNLACLSTNFKLLATSHFDTYGNATGYQGLIAFATQICKQDDYLIATVIDEGASTQPNRAP